MIRTYATTTPASSSAVDLCLVPSHLTRKRPREESPIISLRPARKRRGEAKQNRKVGGLLREDPPAQPSGPDLLPPSHPSFSCLPQKRRCAWEPTSIRAAKIRHLGPSTAIVANRVSPLELVACSQAAARGRAIFSSDSPLTRVSCSRLSNLNRSRSPLDPSTTSSASSSTESSLTAASLSSRAPARPGRPPGRPPGR